MKHQKLQMRDSAIQLISLDKMGGLDTRSEVGKIVISADWDTRTDQRYKSDCSHIRGEQMIPSHVILTDEYLYILRDTNKHGQLIIKARRKLETIMKISRKAKIDGVVKLQYGSKGPEGVHITDTEKLHFPTKSTEFITKLKEAIADIPK